MQIGFLPGGTAYVAVSGGFAAPLQLGSRSTYQRAEIGSPIGFGLQIPCEAVADDGTVRWAEPWTGNDGDSDTYGAGVAHSCRVEQKAAKQLGDSGEVVVQSTVIFLNGTVTVTAKDRITLPDGSKPVILSVNSIPGPDGTAYLKEVLT